MIPLDSPKVYTIANNTEGGTSRGTTLVLANENDSDSNLRLHALNQMKGVAKTFCFSLQLSPKASKEVINLNLSEQK